MTGFNTIVRERPRIARSLRRSRAAELRSSRVDGTPESLLDALKQVFTRRGWGFSELEDAGALLSELFGPLGKWRVLVQTVEEAGVVVLYSICPVQVPEERRDAMAAFLTRANYGLSMASFELDFVDGEVRCRSSLLVQARRLDAAVLETLIRANGRTVEMFLPGMRAVADGTDPLDAIEHFRAPTAP